MAGTKPLTVPEFPERALGVQATQGNKDSMHISQRAQGKVKPGQGLHASCEEGQLLGPWKLRIRSNSSMVYQSTLSSQPNIVAQSASRLYPNYLNRHAPCQVR